MEIKQLLAYAEQQKEKELKPVIMFIFGKTPCFNYFKVVGNELEESIGEKIDGELFLIDCSQEGAYTKSWYFKPVLVRIKMTLISVLLENRINVYEFGENVIVDNILDRMITMSMESAITFEDINYVDSQFKVTFIRILDALVYEGLATKYDFTMCLKDSIFTSPMLSSLANLYLLPSNFFKYGGFKISNKWDIDAYIKGMSWFSYSKVDIGLYAETWFNMIKVYVSRPPSFRFVFYNLLKAYQFGRPLVFEVNQDGFPVYYNSNGVLFDQFLSGSESSISTYYCSFLVSRDSLFCVNGNKFSNNLESVKLPHVEMDSVVISYKEKHYKSIYSNSREVESLTVPDVSSIPSVFTSDLFNFSNTVSRVFLFNIVARPYVLNFTLLVSIPDTKSEILKVVNIPPVMRSFFLSLRDRGSMTFNEVEFLGLSRYELKVMANSYKFYLISEDGVKFWSNA